VCVLYVLLARLTPYVNPFVRIRQACGECRDVPHVGRCGENIRDGDATYAETFRTFSYQNVSHPHPRRENNRWNVDPSWSASMRACLCVKPPKEKQCMADKEQLRQYVRWTDALLRSMESALRGEDPSNLWKHGGYKVFARKYNQLLTEIAKVTPLRSFSTSLISTRSPAAVTPLHFSKRKSLKQCTRMPRF
jgi:hypothetical protein